MDKIWIYLYVKSRHIVWEETLYRGRDLGVFIHRIRVQLGRTGVRVGSASGWFIGVQDSSTLVLKTDNYIPMTFFLIGGQDNYFQDFCYLRTQLDTAKRTVVLRYNFFVQTLTSVRLRLSWFYIFFLLCKYLNYHGNLNWDEISLTWCIYKGYCFRLFVTKKQKRVDLTQYKDIIHWLLKIYKFEKNLKERTLKNKTIRSNTVVTPIIK